MLSIFKISVLTGAIGTAIALPTFFLLTNKTTSKVTNNTLDLAPSVIQSKDPSTSSIINSFPKISEPKKVVKKAISTPKTQLQKLKERADNPDLCRKVLNSNYGDAFLRVCKENLGNSDVEFEYYPSQYSMPVPIINLKFDTRELVITLAEKDDYGYQTVRMDLTADMIVGKGLFSSSVDGKPFTDKECKLEEVQGVELVSNKSDWIINCKAKV